MQALRKSYVALLLVLVIGKAQAQGIPVIDQAVLVQTVQQVINDITQIKNQLQQIGQLQMQINSINGSRNLGTVYNNPALRNYVPAEAYNLVNAVDTNGYGGLNSTAKALRDAGMVYNCMDLQGAARTNCQAELAQPYQQKGLLQDAMKSAAGRLNQISALMEQINATTDQKAIQETQARITAENALLSHEVSQIQMLQGMGDSEERIARSRERERQYETLGRTGHIATQLP